MHKMIFTLAMLISMPVFSKPSRTVFLSEGEQEVIFLEPGYSTLLKFNSKPEPGLIGDQDSFKVEYMKNIVAIKPLASRAKTNLFLFTKEGQFNFQLLLEKGKHDNLVLVERKQEKALPVFISKPKETKKYALDSLSKKRIEKTVKNKNTKMTLESITTLKDTAFTIFYVLLENSKPACSSPLERILPSDFIIMQSNCEIKIESLFLDRLTDEPCKKSVMVTILVNSLEQSKEIILRYKSANQTPPTLLDLKINPFSRH